MMRRVSCLVVGVAACSYPSLPPVGGGEIDGGSPGAPPVVTAELLAGAIGGPGNLDGVAAAARFNGPSALAFDAAGDLYVTDSGNSAIRRVLPTGEVTTYAGALATPTGIAIRASELYVVVSGAHTICRIATAGAGPVTLAGSAGKVGSADGAGAAARFNTPTGLAIDGQGNVLVTDSFNHTIRKLVVSGDTAQVTTIAGAVGVAGSADGAALTAAHFNFPAGIAVDSDGAIYVADTGNQIIRKIAGGTVSTLAGSSGAVGSADGTGAMARFDAPSGLVIDGAHNLYVTDKFNHTIRKVTTAGVVTTLAGSAGAVGSTDGVGAVARFAVPTGIALDGAGDLFIADHDNELVRKLSPASREVTTLAGAAPLPGGADGIQGAARFRAPAGVVVNGDGDLLVADQGNGTIRKLTLAGVVTTQAGVAGMFGSVDGAAGKARFNGPFGLALDAIGTLYVSDRGNHTIRTVAPDGQVTTVAGGAGMAGSKDDSATDARFNMPNGLAFDHAGDLFIADAGNDTIRELSAAGQVTTVAGTPGTAGSADGAAALFNNPSGLAIDGAGDLFVADHNNATVREVAPSGSVATLAGASARFAAPIGVAIDGAGNLYVTDLLDATVRKITPAGVTTTIAGTAGKIGIVLGDHPGLAAPVGITIVGDSLVVTDTDAVLVLRHAAR
jgi:sugar lactone lactonase YvrE